MHVERKWGLGKAYLWPKILRLKESSKVMCVLASQGLPTDEAASAQGGPSLSRGLGLAR